MRAGGRERREQSRLVEELRDNALCRAAPAREARQRRGMLAGQARRRRATSAGRVAGKGRNRGHTEGAGRAHEMEMAAQQRCLAEGREQQIR